MTLAAGLPMLSQNTSPGSLRCVALLALALWPCGLVGGCGAMVRAALEPDAPFDAGVVPAAPDYLAAASWAARPETEDGADVVPNGERDGQTQGKHGRQDTIDVFFVHPTTYYRDASWNQPLDDAETNALTDDAVLRNQASAFNAVGAIYAPRYRQATLAAFMTDDTTSAAAALDLAYGDVRAAFKAFLAQRPVDRPFIVASHSQGSHHALRLLAEEISGTPLRGQLVAAYIIGVGIPDDVFTRLIPDIPVCSTPTQVGCLIGWNTVAEGVRPARFDARSWVPYATGYESNAGKTLVCVNPLSWRTDEVRAPASQHLGAVRFDEDTLAPTPQNAMTWAQCVEGLLAVGELDSAYRRGLGRGGDYHLVDYSVFYMNLRRNAVERVAAFLGASAPDAVAAPPRWPRHPPCVRFDENFSRREERYG